MIVKLIGVGLFFAFVLACFGSFVAEIISAVRAKPKTRISMERREYADARADALNEPLPVEVAPLSVRDTPRVPPYVDEVDEGQTVPLKTWQGMDRLEETAPLVVNQGTYRSSGNYSDTRQLEVEQ